MKNNKKKNIFHSSADVTASIEEEFGLLPSPEELDQMYPDISRLDARFEKMMRNEPKIYRIKRWAPQFAACACAVFAAAAGLYLVRSKVEVDENKTGHINDEQLHSVAREGSIVNTVDNDPALSSALICDSSFSAEGNLIQSSSVTLDDLTELSESKPLISIGMIPSIPENASIVTGVVTGTQTEVGQTDESMPSAGTATSHVTDSSSVETIPAASESKPRETTVTQTTPPTTLQTTQQTTQQTSPTSTKGNETTKVTSNPTGSPMTRPAPTQTTKETEVNIPDKSAAKETVMKRPTSDILSDYSKEVYEDNKLSFIKEDQKDPQKANEVTIEKNQITVSTKDEIKKVDNIILSQDIPIKDNADKGLLVVSETDDGGKKIQIAWTDGDANYTLTASDIPVQDAIDIANSLK